MLPTSPPHPGLAALTRAQARVIWAVIAAVMVVAVVAALAGAAAAPGEPQLGTVFLGVAAAMVVVDLAVAYLVTGRMRRRHAPGAPPDAIAGTQMIVASAVALGAALTCCVFYFVAREPLILLLVVPCAVVLLHWFPSQARWAAIAPAQAAPREKPLVRE